MIRPWPTLASRRVGDFRIFTVRSDEKVSPRTGQPHDFYIIECVDWVNVLAVTPDDQLVMVEQFRHGSNTVELEIPGGIMDAGETSPVDTGVRELREEGNIEMTAPPRLHGIFFNNRASRRDHVALFVVRAFRQSAAPVPNGEIIAHGFFAADALPNDTTAATRERIVEVLGGAPVSERW